VLQEASAAAGHPAYRRYHYGTGPLLVDDGAARRFISTDALGSPTDLTGAGATVASMRKYDAWGQYRNDTAPVASEPKLGFTGHQYDPETGLVYARARYYDPEMGRFLSRDSVEGTIADAPSLHRFMYVRGNPVRYTDPSGHCAVNKDGTLNCVAPAWAMQKQFTARMSSAWAEGNYGKAAYDLLLATANTVSVAAGAASQLVVGTSYNAGYDASAGFSTGDYDRARRGSTELLMIAGAEKAFKAAQWVEETAAPAVKKVAAELAENLARKTAPEATAGAERAAVTQVVEQSSGPGSAAVPEPLAEIGSRATSRIGAEEATSRARLELREGEALARGDGFAEAARVEPGGTGRALSGHGGYVSGSGQVVIPEGTSLTMWAKHGESITDELGQFIERGAYDAIAARPDLAASIEGAASHLPGASIPNYTLFPPRGLVVMRNSVTVDAPKPLSELLTPNQGHLDWAACLVTGVCP
jgi:RHS repeat-associated protein